MIALIVGVVAVAGSSARELESTTTQQVASVTVESTPGSGDVAPTVASSPETAASAGESAPSGDGAPAGDAAPAPAGDGAPVGDGAGIAPINPATEASATGSANDGSDSAAADGVNSTLPDDEPATPEPERPVAEPSAAEQALLTQLGAVLPALAEASSIDRASAVCQVLQSTTDPATARATVNAGFQSDDFGQLTPAQTDQVLTVLSGSYCTGVSPMDLSAGQASQVGVAIPFSWGESGDGIATLNSAEWVSSADGVAAATRGGLLVVQVTMTAVDGVVPVDPALWEVRDGSGQVYLAISGGTASDIVAGQLVAGQSARVDGRLIFDAPPGAMTLRLVGSGAPLGTWFLPQ